jgi:chloride channel 2
MTKVNGRTMSESDGKYFSYVSLTLSLLIALLYSVLPLYLSSFLFSDIFITETSLFHEESSPTSKGKGIDGGLEIKKDNGCCMKIINYWNDSQVTLRTWLYLVLLGILTAIMGWLLDVMYLTVKAGRKKIKDVLPFAAAYPLTMVWAIIWTCLAIACCKKLSVYAKGSGTVEMKTILSGTMLMGPLTMRCFIAKLLGLVCGLGAGLSIGKEGPFIHMSCIIGYQLTGLSYFSALRKNERLLRQLIAAAVSAGITAAFGAPMGGVLFGIEVTATYYMVNNLWRSYLAAVTCIVVAKVMDWTNEKEDFEETDLPETPFGWDFFWYCGLGVICAVGGATFVHCCAVFQKLINFRLSKFSPYLIASIVAVITTATFFPLPFMAYDDIQISNQLFKYYDLSTLGYTHWTTPNVYVTLASFIVIKLIYTAAAVSLPLPCGLYLPMFVMGAATGRLYGEILNLIWPGLAEPGAYSVVAAAAFVGGGTHAVSTAVVVFELTGQLTHMIPVLIGVLVARAIAPAFSIPIYDLLMSIKSLPYLAAANLEHMRDRTAKDLVERDCLYLRTDATFNQAFDLLMKTSGNAKYEEIAVVDPVTMMLVGCTTRRAIVAAIDNFAEQAILDMDETSTRDDVEVDFDEEMNSKAGGLFGAAVPTTSAAEEAAKKADRKKAARESKTADKSKAKDIKASLMKMKEGISVDKVKDFFATETYSIVSYENIAPSQFDSSNDELKSLFNEKVNLVTKISSSNSTSIKVDPAAMSVPESTALTKVHFIFTVTLWVNVYVTHRGRFVGVIGKNEIAMDYTKKNKEKDGH